MQKNDLYVPADVDPDIATELPGAYPFTRGIHRTMYTDAGRPWTMRQFAGFGTARRTNERFLDLLAKGQTGLSTAFDMPTLLGFDSSNPKARGDIGMGGVAVDTLADMELLFKDIDLGKI